MDNERLQYAVDLKKQIEQLRKDLTSCSIMLEHGHNHLEISSTSMKFRLPPSQANTILTIAKNAIERELDSSLEEFNNL